ncbi:alpha/beta fold hydrolase [Cellulomonas sp. HZM]|uniref:alpha/beta fold hydrolase n=1 Tax=Cellulomonas sp. HZM TaxID=1454010 RepID=UPI000493182F|nr:alpha/beta fold hydrolase [Cellulomonas sp. HZM]
MTFHELRTGTGTPVVLLHAFPLDHRMWLDVADALEGRTVLAVDLPGSAGSPPDRPEPSVDAAADRLAAQLDAAGVGHAVVAGLSMGGYVALALAERRPDLVAALGLVDTKSTADTDDARANRLRIAAEADEQGTVAPVRPMAQTLLGASTRNARPELQEQVAQWIEEQPPAGVAWSQRAMAARPDRTDVLAAFAGPAVVVVGAEDTLTPLDQAEHMAAAASAPLVVVPAAGHLSALERPAAVAAALDELVGRTDAGLNAG